METLKLTPDYINITRKLVEFGKKINLKFKDLKYKIITEPCEKHFSFFSIVWIINEKYFSHYKMISIKNVSPQSLTVNFYFLKSKKQ